MPFSYAKARSTLQIVPWKTASAIAAIIQIIDTHAGTFCADYRLKTPEGSSRFNHFCSFFEPYCSCTPLYFNTDFKNKKGILSVTGNRLAPKCFSKCQGYWELQSHTIACLTTAGQSQTKQKGWKRGRKETDRSQLCYKLGERGEGMGCSMPLSLSPPLSVFPSE